MGRTAVVVAVVAVVLYYLVYILPTPTFPVHSSGAVVVTGASSGIGLHAAIVLVSKGYTVFATVRKEADGAGALKECTQELGSSCTDKFIPVICDVTKFATVDTLLEQVSAWVKSHNQPLVGLVNNAGISKGGPVETMPLQTFRDVMEVNYFGLVYTTQKFLPLLRQHHGRIVNIGSVAGRIALATMGVYSGSKFALEAFSDALRQELLPLGVSVSIVEPAYVKTKIGDKSIEYHESKELSEEYQALYGRFLKNAKARVERVFSKADPPTVTSDAITHALLTPNPQARYVVANVDGMPAKVLVWLAGLVPENLLDRVGLLLNSN